MTVTSLPSATTRWRPISPVSRGELWPCGSNPSGSMREFFAHKDDVNELLAIGITIQLEGVRTRFRCELTSTPDYANGDVQIRAVQVQPAAVEYAVAA